MRASVSRARAGGARGRAAPARERQTAFGPARREAGRRLRGRGRRYPIRSGVRAGSPARAEPCTRRAAPVGRLRSSRTMYSGRCLTSS